MTKFIKPNKPIPAVFTLEAGFSIRGIYLQIIKMRQDFKLRSTKQTPFLKESLRELNSTLLFFSTLPLQPVFRANFIVLADIRGSSGITSNCPHPPAKAVELSAMTEDSRLHASRWVV